MQQDPKLLDAAHIELRCRSMKFHTGTVISAVEIRAN